MEEPPAPAAPCAPLLPMPRPVSIRSLVLTLVLVVGGLLTVVASRQAMSDPGEGNGEELVAVGFDALPAQGIRGFGGSETGDGTGDPSHDDPRVDSARAELAIGRFFHASELLREVAADGALEPAERFLLARAEAGYRHWAGVVDVLEGAAWVEQQPGALVLLARALEGLGRDEDAIAAYRSSLGVETGPVPEELRTTEAAPYDAGVRAARLARLLFADGDRTAGLEVVDRIVTASPVLASAVMVGAMEGSVEAGDTAFVRSALARITLSGERDRLWEATAAARLAAGDTTRALELYRGLTSESEPAPRRARGFEILGDVARARGDTTNAVDHHRTAHALAPWTGPGMRSARWVVDHAELDAKLALALARSLDRLGDGRRALRAYDAHLRLARESGADPDASARVDRARLAATVPGRVEEAIEEYRALGEHPDPEIGARVLELWAALRRRQGESAREATLREWLVERYPDTDASSQIVFLRADAAHDRRQWDQAIDLYDEVAEMAPGRRWASLARMRIGQIHLTRGEIAKADSTFTAYLAEWPDGGRWEEAAYWTARTRRDLGLAESIDPILSRLREEEPFGYYTVMTGELVGERFQVPGIPGGSITLSPATERWIEEVRLLDVAGFDDVADRHVGRAIEAGEAGGVPDDRLALAHALNELGRTIDGINLGWQLRREGMPWSRALLGIVYPFPFREMIEAEAREWGLDPILVGALIRQESAFVEDIRSHAGAIGLMQVMPATGAEVARAVGPRNFTPASLETAEVNLHLGSRFLVEMLDRFGPDLPLVLSAYNAGPTRANRWQDFPEFVELDRFTERIPFEETRGYVKNITRNLAIYRAIYGEPAVSD